MAGTIAAAILGSAGITTFIQFLIQRADTRHGTLEKIVKEIDMLRADILRGRAVSARIRILCGADEVRTGVRHSQEWWDQALDDCSFYEKYCEENPNFRNKKAMHAILYLTDTYSKVYEKNDFI